MTVVAKQNRRILLNNLKAKLGSIWEVFVVALKLGLTSFGGPIAHIGYFHAEYVQRKKWMEERSFSDLVALCQLLPGPASSQLGIGIGTIRCGLWGGIAAWLGFTLPSALILIVFEHLLGRDSVASAPWIHGLKIVALVVVFQAVLSMWSKLVRGPQLATIAIVVMAVNIAWSSAISQIASIGLSAILGLAWMKQPSQEASTSFAIGYKKRFGAALLLTFIVLLVTLPILREFHGGLYLQMADGFYRSGSLVFGGGHVVLPFLQREFVGQGAISQETFLAGYGAVQAVPGPLFTLSAFLGMSMAGIRGALIGLLAMFLPAFLLIVGALPFWDSLRNSPRLSGVLVAINASVVGILLSALYDPIWVTAIQRPIDLALAAILALQLMVWKGSPVVTAGLGVAGSILLNQVGVF